MLQSEDQKLKLKIPFIFSMLLCYRASIRLSFFDCLESLYLIIMFDNIVRYSSSACLLKQT